MLEPVVKQVHDVEGLLLGFRRVERAELQNLALSPFVEILDFVEKVDDHFGADGDASLFGEDFFEGFNRVLYYQGILISDHFVQRFD